jgi:hypothetical protein
MDREDVGDVRLEVQPRGDEEVFVGIAPTDQVSRYLTGAAHTSVSDVDSWPFDADYEEHAIAGERKPAPPAEQAIWTASAQGAGTQTLEWDVEDGDWSVVVMNADGSRGVDAEVEAGAKVPYLSAIGWTVLGTGAVLMVAAAALLVAGIRTPRNRSAAGTSLAPAAA